MRSTQACPGKRARRIRDDQRGAALVTVLVAMVALLGTGAVTMLAVRSDTVASGADRFQQIALYAAESGAAAGADYLRVCTPGTYYSNLVEPRNVNPQRPLAIVGNLARPGTNANPFGSASKTWYEVTILNNTDDPGFAAGNDTDATVILDVIGHGPGQTVTRVTLEVKNPGCEPCTDESYTQGGAAASGRTPLPGNAGVVGRGRSSDSTA